MPHTDLLLSYNIKLTHNEYRLVTMALAGILIDQEDINDSLALNVKLCQQRLKGLDDAADTAEKALEGAELKANPNVPPTKRK